MAILELQDIEFNYQDRELYNKASMKLNPGEHACLLGKNGGGKTTLLNIIVGDIKQDSGDVIWDNNVTYSYLDQHLKIVEDIITEDYLYGVYDYLFIKEKRMEELYEKGALDIDNFDKYCNQAERIRVELDENGFYSLQEKVGRLTDGLGLDKEHLLLPLSKLSSGQREKAYLIRMLLEEKQVLIMDEPTNFLDASQVEWLARYLKGYPNAFLVVSHDMEFVKQISNVIFLLENGNITRYVGDYDYYVTQHAIDSEQYRKNYEAQKRYIKKEEQFIAKHIVRATSAKAAKSHRARLNHIDRMEAPKSTNSKVSFNFIFSGDVGNEPFSCSDLVIGYEKPLLDPINFTLRKGEKIAILGQNGVGKSTFIKTIINDIPKIDGDFKWLDGINVNYFGQDIPLNMNLTPFSLIQSNYPNLNNTQVRTLLGRVGLSNELAMRQLNKLSGGEVTKARLALMSLKKCNFLILDEPTNHLDKSAKEALFESLSRFPGSVILVSHEKDFYDGLVDYELYF